MIKILKKIWPLFLLVLVSMLLLPTVLPEKSYASNVNNDYIKYTIKTDEEAWIKREEKKLKFIKKHKLKLFLFICLIDIPIILISFIARPEAFEKWIVLLGFFATLFLFVSLLYRLVI